MRQATVVYLNSSPFSSISSCSRLWQLTNTWSNSDDLDTNSESLNDVMSVSANVQVRKYILLLYAIRDVWECTAIYRTFLRIAIIIKKKRQNLIYGKYDNYHRRLSWLCCWSLLTFTFQDILCHCLNVCKN